MPEDQPKWRRRKEARPAEIVDAALEVFAEKGFAAAKLDDIARKAGISKATLYLYFDTKEEIFRAVAQSAVASLLEALESQSEGTDAPFAELAPKLLLHAAEMMKGGRVPAIARIVIGESRTFPDLARIWHDDVVASVIGIDGRSKTSSPSGRDSDSWSRRDGELSWHDLSLDTGGV
jgi:AcrR family transcriptional regulator